MYRLCARLPACCLCDLFAHKKVFLLMCCLCFWVCWRIDCSVCVCSQTFFVVDASCVLFFVDVAHVLFVCGVNVHSQKQMLAMCCFCLLTYRMCVFVWSVFMLTWFVVVVSFEFFCLLMYCVLCVILDRSMICGWCLARLVVDVLLFFCLVCASSAQKQDV